jgi:hypothetical protein
MAAKVKIRPEGRGVSPVVSGPRPGILEMNGPACHVAGPEFPLGDGSLVLSGALVRVSDRCRLDWNQPQGACS